MAQRVSAGLRFKMDDDKTRIAERCSARQPGAAVSTRFNFWEDTDHLDSEGKCHANSGL